MILHLVCFRWKETVTPDDVARLEQELATFRQRVDCMLEYHFGRDLGLRPGNADFGIAALVADASELVNYLEHPAHHELTAHVLGPMVASRDAVQIGVQRAMPEAGGPPSTGTERTTAWP